MVLIVYKKIHKKAKGHTILERFALSKKRYQNILYNLKTF